MVKSIWWLGLDVDSRNIGHAALDINLRKKWHFGTIDVYEIAGLSGSQLLERLEYTNQRLLDLIGVLENYGKIGRVIVEMPEYQGPNRARTLAPLSFSVGYIVSSLAPNYPITLLKPGEWKGRLSKPRCHRRMWRFFDLPVAKTDHEADAAGLVLYAAGFRPKKPLSLTNSIAYKIQKK